MSLADFQTMQTLGQGTYSTVYKVRRLSDGQVYALKQVPMGKLKPKDKANAVNEVRILASVTHPNVVAYKEAFFDEPTQSLCIVMEYADCGDLLQRVRAYQKKGTYMAESFVWTCLIQLVRGLKALHDLSIFHRDLKSANVFLTSSEKVQVGDLNVAKVAKEGLLHTQTGTPYYASPEVWRDQPYDGKSDIWSLGCVIYEAASLKPPFRAEDLKGLYARVITGEYPQLPRHFSQDLRSVVGACLALDPRQRPSCEEILAMPQVLQRLQTDNCPEGTANLLGTIQVTGNSFADCFPAPTYEMLASPEKTRSPDKMRSSRRRAEYSSGLSPSKRHRSFVKQPQLSGHLSLKEPSGGLKLPKLGGVSHSYNNSEARRKVKPPGLKRPAVHN